MYIEYRCVLDRGYLTTYEVRYTHKYTRVTYFNDVYRIVTFNKNQKLQSSKSCY